MPRMIDASVVPSKELGLDLAIGDEFIDANNVRYKIVKARNVYNCDGCALSNHRNAYAKLLCNRICCAYTFRKDRRAAMVSVAFAPPSMRETIELCKR